MSRRSIGIPNATLAQRREITGRYIGRVGVTFDDNTSREHNEETENSGKPRGVFPRPGHWSWIIVLGAVKSQPTHVPIFESSKRRHSVISLESTKLSGILSLAKKFKARSQSGTSGAHRKIAADSLREDLLRRAFDSRRNHRSDSTHYPGLAPDDPRHSASLIGFALVCREGKTFLSEVQAEAATAQEKDFTKTSQRPSRFLRAGG